MRVTCLFVCNILTFVDWWVKWKIGSWSLQIFLLFNEFFLYLNTFHRNLNLLKQTCTFLHLLTQLSSLSYVCFICRCIFNFATAFLFCRGCFFVFCFFCSSFFILSVTFLFCRDFFILPLLFNFAVVFLFRHDILVLPWFFYFSVSV